MNVLIDPDLPAPQLRERLYGGSLVVFTRLDAVQALVGHTREQLDKLFAPYQPECAHEHFDRAEMARLLGGWKPAYIHSAESKRLVRDIIREAGFADEATHYDVPKPRTSFPEGHLTTGIAYAFPWHRDVWYSAPAQQINWWVPVLGASEGSCVTFDMASFDRPVINTSSTFDYYEINKARLHTAEQVTAEEQSRPAAIDFEPVNEVLVLPPPGAILLFSGAHLHRSLPNCTRTARFSVDFRTVDVGDLTAGRGARLRDVQCTGTSIRDFHNVADDSAFDETTVRALFGAPPPGAMLIFRAPSDQS